MKEGIDTYSESQNNLESLEKQSQERLKELVDKIRPLVRSDELLSEAIEVKMMQTLKSVLVSYSAVSSYELKMLLETAEKEWSRNQATFTEFYNAWMESNSGNEEAQQRGQKYQREAELIEVVLKVVKEMFATVRAN